MIEKINRRSSERGVTRYLLSATGRFGEPRFASPEVVHGDPELLDATIKSSTYAQPYLSGELSWGEDLDTVGRAKAIMTARDYVSLLAADLPLSEFSILLVLHRRKRGFDIHFVMAKMHLKTSHQFPYYRDTSADQAIRRTWRRHQNLVNGWTDPEDPEHKSYRSQPSRYAKPAERRAHIELDQRVVQWVRSGLVKDVDELVAMLRSDRIPTVRYRDGLKVFYANQKLKFLGGKYSDGFDFESAGQDRAPRCKRSRKDIDAEIAVLDGKLHTYRPRRAQCYAAKFSGGQPLFARGVEPRVAGKDPGFPNPSGTIGGSGETVPPHPRGGATIQPEAVVAIKSSNAHADAAPDPSNRDRSTGDGGASDTAKSPSAAHGRSRETQPKPRTNLNQIRPWTTAYTTRQRRNFIR